MQTLAEEAIKKCCFSNADGECQELDGTGVEVKKTVFCAPPSQGRDERGIRVVMVGAG